MGRYSEDLSGDAAFQASHDLETAEPFGSTPGHVCLGLCTAPLTNPTPSWTPLCAGWRRLCVTEKAASLPADPLVGCLTGPHEQELE